MSRGVRALFVFLGLVLIGSLFLNYRLLTKGVDEGKCEQDTAQNPAPVQEEQQPKQEDELYIRNQSFCDDHLEIYFSSLLPEDITSENIAVTPEIELSAIYNYGNEIDLYGDWKSGETYSITLTVGDVKLSTVMVAPDRSPRSQFRTCGKLFPLSNDFWNLGVKTLNTQGDLKVCVKEAYPNQVLRFLNSPTNDSFSHTISEKIYPLKKVKNQEEKVVIDLDEVGVPRKSGLYSIQIFDAEQDWNARDAQALIVTDLGVIITCNGTEIAVAVRSLKDNTPVVDASVELYTKKYQLVESAKTDGDGFCRLPYSELTDREDSIRFAVVTKDDDMTICDADFWKDNTPLDKAELYCERGICRPGEDIRVFGTLRDKDLRAKGGVPLEFSLRDTHYDVIQKQVVTGDAQGLYAVNWTLDENAPLGRYSISAYAPGNANLHYGDTDFLVGEYIPDRIRLTLNCEGDKENLSINAESRASYYFGTPFTTGTIRQYISAHYGVFAPKGYEDFTFGAADPYKEASSDTNSQKPNAEGVCKASFDISSLRTWVENPVSVSVFSSCIPDGAGRTVCSEKTLTFDFADYYLGGYHDYNAKDFMVKLIGVTPAGKEIPLMDKALRYELSHITWNYTLQEQSYNGLLQRAWVQSKTKIHEGEVVLQDGFLNLKDITARGEFQLDVFDKDGAKRLSMEMWHWGGEAGVRMKDPRCLDFKLDKEKYLPGETATLTFDCGMDGEGIAFPGLRELSAPIRFPVKAGENQVQIPIPENLVHGKFCVGIHVLCRKDTASDPMHLEGMAELAIDQKKHKLHVALDVPAEARPETDIPITMKVTDADGSPAKGEILAWGVDEGILALTAYRTPDPFEDFFVDCNNPLRASNNYDSLYPVVNAGTEKIGGGANASARRSRNREKLAKPAIVFLGTFATDENGVATATATMPDFTGEMRIMAIAVNDECTGAGDAAVVVRRETSLEVTAPRVVSPGDEFSIVFQGFNHSLPDGVAHWEAVVEELDVVGSTQGDFTLAKGGTAIGVLKLKGKGTEGRGKVHFKLTMGECQSTAEVDIVVRSPNPPVTTFEIVDIPAGEEREFDLDQYAFVNIGTTALALTSSLDWLAQYPYGCLEQITATAFPMLAVKPLAEAGVLPEIYAECATQKIKGTLSHLNAYRLYNGQMSMWPNGVTWIDGSFFAYLFYLEADKQGFQLDSAFRKQMEGRLVEFLNKRNTDNFAERAFAALVLSYIAPSKAYAYSKLLEDAKCDDFSRILKAVVQIRSGYSAEGMSDLEKLLPSCNLASHTALYGFDSDTRRVGIVLWLLSDIVPEGATLQKFASDLFSRRNAEGHWGNTQDNAWAALGLAKYCAKTNAKGEFSMTVTVDGKAQEFKSAKRFVGPKKIRVKNTSGGTIQAFICKVSSLVEPKATANGMVIHREYRDLAGNIVTHAKRGDALQVVLTMKFQNDAINEFVISDLLPGGLEIEDDTLATRSKTLKQDDDKTDKFNFSNLEKCFDRFLAFGNANYANEDTEYTYTYQVRAVSEGTFAVAPIAIESMYHADLKAIELPTEKTFTVLPADTAK